MPGNRQGAESDDQHGGGGASCLICGGRGFIAVGDFAFGWWETSGPAAARRTCVYHLLTCDVCGHVRVDAAAVARDYGAGFVASLYALPQTPERPGVEDAGVADAMAEILAYADMAEAPLGRIVDFGCGDGALLTVLRDRLGAPADRLLGVDFAPRLVGIPVAAVDLNRLEEAGALPGDGFDAAFCVQTLEHLIDPRGFLRGLRRRAGPGARLYLEVPEHARLTAAAAQRADLLSAQHLHYFSLRTLRLLTESCGWTVIKADVDGVETCPRARLLAVAAPVDDTHIATLAVRRSFDDMWRRAAAVLLQAAEGPEKPALWGLGGDFFRLIEASAALEAAVQAGRFLLADSGLAGKTWRGCVVVDARTLVGDGGAPIYLTPRPPKVYGGMLAAAAKLGIAPDRLRRPYHDG